MISINIKDGELVHHNKSKSNKKGSPARVCVSPETHKKLKRFAADHEVSMQTVIECIVNKLNIAQEGT